MCKLNQLYIHIYYGYYVCIKKNDFLFLFGKTAKWREQKKLSDKNKKKCIKSFCFYLVKCNDFFFIIKFSHFHRTEEKKTVEKPSIYQRPSYLIGLNESFVDLVFILDVNGHSMHTHEKKDYVQFRFDNWI